MSADHEAVLRERAAAMGLELRTYEVSGEGWSACLAWPDGVPRVIPRGLASTRAEAIDRLYQGIAQPADLRDT